LREKKKRKREREGKFFVNQQQLQVQMQMKIREKFQLLQKKNIAMIVNEAFQAETAREKAELKKSGKSG
jgi:hypothetical protein